MAPIRPPARGQSFPATPIPPHLSAAHAQNTTIISAMMRAAVAFAADGYDVFLDGILGPWFMPHVAAEVARRIQQGDLVLPVV